MYFPLLREGIACVGASSSLRGKTVSFDEAISCQNPEIATLLSVARNDDEHTLTF